MHFKSLHFHFIHSLTLTITRGLILDNAENFRIFMRDLLQDSATTYDRRAFVQLLLRNKKLRNKIVVCH